MAASVVSSSDYISVELHAVMVDSSKSLKLQQETGQHLSWKIKDHVQDVYLTLSFCSCKIKLLKSEKGK